MQTPALHAYANGRRRKCVILHLQSKQRLLLSQGHPAYGFRGA